MRAEYHLQDEQWTAKQGKYKPDVKVEQEIPDVERPWLSAKDARAFSGTTENVVGDDVPRDDNQFTIEDAVDNDLEKL